MIEHSIIAQVSDIHAAPGNDGMPRFERALALLAGFGPDAVVLTGDLIDDGWTEGYTEIGTRLATLKCPVLLLPGNSDDRHAMQGVFDGRVGAIGDGDAMHFSARIGALRLIGIDASLPGSSSGDVTPHLGWLNEALRAEGTENTLLFSHHHFVPCGIPPLDEVIGRGGAALDDLFASLSTKPLALSSGHVHRPMSAMLAGVPAHICGSICVANPLWFGGSNVPAVNEPPMIMVHRLTSDGLVSNHVAV
ncbi:metallophosphoesterase [Ruegeria sp. EL01]|uniref:metallophosphoesterase n=1 Tax=Ruegeria sp. EL01 TaxID=2107578 RepID=UPI000EA81424|nr:metallophosphoesterase [Ruegeria sp. EL01]